MPAPTWTDLSPHIASALVDGGDTPRLHGEYNVLNYGAIGDGTTHPVSEWLTGGARDRGYANLAAIQADYPEVVALTDEIDWAAIQRACRRAYQDNNGSVGQPRSPVMIPRGDFMVNRQIETGHEVPLIGLARSASRIRATDAFLTDQGADSAVIKLSLTDANGTGGPQFEHNNLIFRISIICDGRADIGVECYNLNENGGLDDFEIRGWRKKGIVLGSANAGIIINYRLRDGHMPSDHVVVEDPIGIHLVKSNHPIEIDNMTITGYKPGKVRTTAGVGIQVNSDAFQDVMVRNCHFEGNVDGVRAMTGRVFVQNCDGFNVDHVVHFTGNAQGWAELLTSQVTQGSIVGRCIRDSSTAHAATPIVFGQFTMNKRYAANRARGLGGHWSGASTITTDANGFAEINHGMPTNPTVVLVAARSETARHVQVRSTSTTVISIRVWDIAAGAWLANTALLVSYYAEP